MKKIVLLSDGTGNGAAKRNKTNVWRLYRALDLHDGDQVAMHDDGVGSQEFLLFKLLGGAFGWGLKRNVIELYEFLCRNYDVDTENKIYLFGFSRGAFTIRVLAGLIAECGICANFNSASDLRKKALHNYDVYRARFRHCQLSTLFVRKLSSKDAYTTFRPEIEFIGVWDTVDAYGFPIDELAELWDSWIIPLRFPDQQLWDGVNKACHAISIDDERHTFLPVLWDESGEKNPNRIEQVWFAGVHSDVGGGYSRHDLALVSLDWMISKVEANSNNPTGLKFRADLREEYWRRSDSHGAQHDSRSGLAAYYRYQPRSIEVLCNNPNSDINIAVPKIHRSVFERIRGNVVPYAPTGLPESYQIVTTRNGDHPSFESETQAKNRVVDMQDALDVICWRLWLYRGFILTNLMLFFSQYYLDWKPCKHDFCVNDPTLDIIGMLLPDFITGWIQALWQNPKWLAAFVFLYVFLGIVKRTLLAKTQDKARAAWANREKNETEAT